ncbi:hypothetical protein AGMMS50229_02050 [Campylobacterota bacterium]|nr:hypothetical protein AGMMS50229_02050 [Campylobacterota bacterium]
MCRAVSAPLFALAAVWLSANESFITEFEYGQKLYLATESIACATCHGENGGGKTLAAYERKRTAQTIAAPAIAGFEASAIKRGLSRHGFGPPYHLSDSEIAAIAEYLGKSSER